MELLVSVRSAEEAEAALAGGAGLIDVKEPARGALGRADDEALAAVVRAVAGRRPVSAALGELLDRPALPAAPVAFVKWGLAGLARADWVAALEEAARHLAEAWPSCRPVAVAYADGQRAGAPPPQDVCSFACDRGWGAFLIDTWHKDGTGLLDWLSASAIVELRTACRRARVPMALAGSLTPHPIRVLGRLVRPDWVAVRGAACRDGRRDGPIDAAAVRRLSDLIAASRPAG